MDVGEVFEDLFGRVDEYVHAVVDGLTPAQLATAPAPGANPIGWLVWHLTRVQDGYITAFLGGEEVWTSGPWPERFGLDRDPHNTGYGHTPERRGGPRRRCRRPRRLLRRGPGSHDAVPRDDRPDRARRDRRPRWDPPVTLGVRLVSIADDCLQHAGQAAYVRGWILGPTSGE